MRHFISILIVLFAFTLTASRVYAGDDATGKFQKIKSLAGEWQGKRGDGKQVTVTYEVVSNGSTVMERIIPEDEPNMSPCTILMDKIC